MALGAVALTRLTHADPPGADVVQASRQEVIGKRRVRERTHALARRLKAGLADLPGIVLHTPMAETLSAGLVCFEVGSRPPEELVERLKREHGIVASVTPYASR
ncbi:MAG: hypothetical protein ACRDOG_02045 [Gaiellaceae bacterium]